MKISKKGTLMLFVGLFCFSGNLPVAFSGEAEDNAKIDQKCIEWAKTITSSGGPQVTPHCQQAAYYKCLADSLCDKYKDQCGALKQRKMASCEIIQSMNSDCKVCSK